jgi:hypothetical protein
MKAFAIKKQRYIFAVETTNDFFTTIFWASRFVARTRGAMLLASGYPLHHLRAFHALRWFRYYPSRKKNA